MSKCQLLSSNSNHTWKIPTNLNNICQYFYKNPFRVPRNVETCCILEKVTQLFVAIALISAKDKLEENREFYV